MSTRLKFGDVIISDKETMFSVAFVTSLAKEVMFLVWLALVSLSLVCLFVCLWTTLLKKL